MKQITAFTVLLAIMLSFSFNSFAEDTTGKKELKIKVFFHCKNGKASIEKSLVKIEGISKASASLESKIVTISYNPEKMDKEKIVAEIEKMGYMTEFSKKDAKVEHKCSGKH